MLRRAKSESRQGQRKLAAGFTIVEMIIAIVIVSIISAMALSRLLGGDTFNAFIIRDQIVSLTRIAQQASLGRAGVKMTITPAADSVTISVAEVGGVIESVVIESRGIVFNGDINKLVSNQTPSCGADAGDNVIAALTPMTINFDELGDLALSGVTGATGAITSAVRICLNDAATSTNVESVCISPAGFAYAGVCNVDP